MLTLIVTLTTLSIMLNDIMKLDREIKYFDDNKNNIIMLGKAKKNGTKCEKNNCIYYFMCTTYYLCCKHCIDIFLHPPDIANIILIYFYMYLIL